MILYLDTSALVKLYIQEQGSEHVATWVHDADPVVTSLISKAEAAAAFARAVRQGILRQEEALSALEELRAEWQHFVRVSITEGVVANADMLAWKYQLRGYDAVHLASALHWRDAIGEDVTLATYDRELWDAARRVNLGVLPEGKGEVSVTSRAA
jgi:predicted nucleic acid-binding protein